MGAILTKKPPRPVNFAMASIKSELGVDTIRELHRESAVLDAVGVAAYLGFVVGLFVLLAISPFGLLWALCFLAQGFALQSLGLLSHDAFIHRRIWGDRGSWFGAMVFSLPVLLPPTWYAISHQDHHTHLGTEHDTETYKSHLDTVWKRALFLTVIGDRLAKSGKFASGNGDIPVIVGRNHKERSRLRVERVGLLVFLMVVAAASFIWPRYLLAGYVLPLVIAAPLASSLRIILEHAEADPANDFHVATYYRTGLITRILFVADAGDCHLIHHVFSHIPWYRMGRAARLMRPILISRGVVERTSIWQLLVGWFVRAYPHRSVWFRPEVTP